MSDTCECCNYGNPGKRADERSEARTSAASGGYSLEDVREDRRRVEGYDAEEDYESAHSNEDYMHMEFIRCLAAGKYTSWAEVARIAEEMVALDAQERTRWYA
jgi:hypothetical protein